MLVDNTVFYYCLLFLFFTLSLAVTVQGLSHTCTTGEGKAGCPLLDNLFGPSNVICVINTTGWHITCSWTQMHYLPQTWAATPSETKDIKNKSVVSSWLGLHKVSASKNTEKCSHSFSGHLALLITSQISGYTRRMKAVTKLETKAAALPSLWTAPEARHTAKGQTLTRYWCCECDHRFQTSVS